MSQTAYNQDFGSPKPGMKGNGSDIDVVTGISPSATPTPFGSFVVRNSGQVLKAPSSSGDITDPSTLAGVAMSTFSVESFRDSLPAHYEPNGAVNVLRKGPVWVKFEDALPALDGAVFVRFTANGLLVPGSFRTDADSGKAVALPACKVKKLGTAGDKMAMIELNMPFSV